MRIQKAVLAATVLAAIPGLAQMSGLSRQPGREQEESGSRLPGHLGLVPSFKQRLEERSAVAKALAPAATAPCGHIKVIPALEMDFKIVIPMPPVKSGMPVHKGLPPCPSIR